jgi:hypothetical protein
VRLSKPKRLLVCDWETSGVPGDHVLDYESGPQGIWVGAIVAERRPEDELGWVEVDRYSSKIRYEGTWKGVQHGRWPGLSWNEESVRFHGQEIHDLHSGGDMVSVGHDLRDLIGCHWAPDEPVVMCGHNPYFDRYFTRQCLHLSGLLGRVQLSYKMVDTQSVGLVVLGSGSSDDIFGLVGIHRDFHDPLEDALGCLRVIQYVHAGTRSMPGRLG